VELDDRFKFGMFKDVALKDVLKDDRGKKWVAWYIDQPPSNPKFAMQDAAQKNKLRKTLENYSNPAPVEKKKQSSDSHLIVDIIEMKTQMILLNKRIKKIEDFIGVGTTPVFPEPEPMEPKGEIISPSEEWEE
jgi:hypothetical protein